MSFTPRVTFYRNTTGRTAVCWRDSSEMLRELCVAYDDDDDMNNRSRPVGPEQASTCELAKQRLRVIKHVCFCVNIHLLKISFKRIT